MASAPPATTARCSKISTSTIPACRLARRGRRWWPCRCHGQGASDEFNCLGAFSDAAPDACQELRFIVTDDPALESVFKTPSLRQVALRAPYMHAGQLASLREVIAHYVKSPPAVVGYSELAHETGRHAERKPIRLSDSEVRNLGAFLRAL